MPSYCFQIDPLFSHNEWDINGLQMSHGAPRRGPGGQVLAPDARQVQASTLSPWLGQARPPSAVLLAPDRPLQHSGKALGRGGYRNGDKSPITTLSGDTVGSIHRTQIEQTVKNKQHRGCPQL